MSGPLAEDFERDGLRDAADLRKHGPAWNIVGSLFGTLIGAVTAIGKSLEGSANPPAEKLVQCGKDLWLRPSRVSSIVWDRGMFYVNGPGKLWLIIRTIEGHEYRIEHTTGLYDAVDCYAIEKALTQGG